MRIDAIRYEPHTLSFEVDLKVWIYILWFLARKQTLEVRTRNNLYLTLDPQPARATGQ